METATIENLPNNKCAIFFICAIYPFSRYSTLPPRKCQTVSLDQIIRMEDSPAISPDLFPSRVCTLIKPQLQICRKPVRMPL